MNKLDIWIAGSNGVFGRFLLELLAPVTNITRDADTVLLCVPLDAYEEVARQHRGKHLVNVCSTQFQSMAHCLRFSDDVTGLHPLFGPNSPEHDRTAILTRECNYSWPIIKCFAELGVEIISEHKGDRLTAELHDEIMYLTHFKGVQFIKQAKSLIDDASWIPENLMPTSFKKIKQLYETMTDMPEGTISSIEANKFKEEVVEFGKTTKD